GPPLLTLTVFSTLALGALTGFQYVALLAGETRAPARNIGLFRTDFRPDHRIDVHSRNEFGAGIRTTGQSGSHWSDSAGIEHRLWLLWLGFNNRFAGDLWSRCAANRFDEHLLHGQCPSADGISLGPLFAGLFHPAAPTLYN